MDKWGHAYDHWGVPFHIMSQVKEAMLEILDDLRPGDKFNIATFSDYVFYWEKDGMVDVTDDSISKAKAFTQKIAIFGG